MIPEGLIYDIGFYIVLVLVLILIFVILSVLFFPAIWSGVSRKRNKEEQDVSVSAKLIKKQYNQFYYLTFLLDYEKQEEFKVPSNIFDSLQEGDTGELTYRGDKYIKFKIQKPIE